MPSPIDTPTTAANGSQEPEPERPCTLAYPIYRAVYLTKPFSAQSKTRAVGRACQRTSVAHGEKGKFCHEIYSHHPSRLMSLKYFSRRCIVQMTGPPYAATPHHLPYRRQQYTCHRIVYTSALQADRQNTRYLRTSHIVPHHPIPHPLFITINPQYYNTYAAPLSSFLSSPRPHHPRPRPHPKPPVTAKLWRCSSPGTPCLRVS